jgi:SNF2 family DNA or RNA helicase
MGLGKTVQVIGLLVAVLRLQTSQHTMPEYLRPKGKRLARTHHGTALIIVPNAVLFNWQKELSTWGHFRVGVIDSAKHDLKQLDKADRGELDVVLTKYNMVTKHTDDFLNTYQGGAKQHRSWVAIVCDEIHVIKNPNSQKSKALRLFKSCTRRIGLTGTVLQNNYNEYWNVMDWICPGIFGTHVT